MVWHTVRQGEDLKSIASSLVGGHSADDIRQSPENRELFRSRRDTVLLPGDRIFLPEMEMRYVDADTDQKHVFVRRENRRLRLVIENQNHEPLANIDYALNVEGDWHEGTTDDEGRLDEPIPMNAQLAALVISERTYQIRIAHLDPIDSTTGVQARLRNLGLDLGPIDGDYGPKTSEAVRTFQEMNDLEPTGEINDQTRQALEQKHRC